MVNLGPGSRVFTLAHKLPKVGDVPWHIHHALDRGEVLYGTIEASTAAKTWSVRLDFDDSTVMLKSRTFSFHVAAPIQR